MRHLRTSESYTVRLILFKNVRHALVDIRLLVEPKQNSTRLIPRIDEIRRMLTRCCIIFALLLELFEAREFLCAIRLILERCLLNRLFILLVCLVQLRCEL